MKVSEIAKEVYIECHGELVYEKIAKPLGSPTLNRYELVVDKTISQILEMIDNMIDGVERAMGNSEDVGYHKALEQVRDLIKAMQEGGG